MEKWSQHRFRGSMREFRGILSRSRRRGKTALTQRCRAALSMNPGNPHLTLTLSPPIGWERRGNSKRTPIVLWKKWGQRQVQGFNARIFSGNSLPLPQAREDGPHPALSRRSFHERTEPTPHPDPLPSHRMGAEREQQADADRVLEKMGSTTGSGVQCAKFSGEFSLPMEIGGEREAAGTVRRALA